MTKRKCNKCGGKGEINGFGMFPFLRVFAYFPIPCPSCNPVEFSNVRGACLKPGKQQLKKGVIMNASAKIMLSYNYCHFEICLSTEVENDKEADELRKRVQRLADKAVGQYQVAKQREGQRADISYEKKKLEGEVREIKQTPQNEWNAEQKAKVKALGDREYWSQFNYDYEDDEDWPEY